ncbi:MAG: BatA domain-containing protein [Bacteroidales bacterium]|nr:BatA domain-containing protein [Bacteroidales bacterium]
MTLASPLFLLGLVAIAIPVAVHLFSFRRYRKVYFSNVAALQEMQHETRRRRNLRERLVLAARILAIVFLVLAFARPVIHPRGANITPEIDATVSVYLDNTFSMGQTDSRGILLLTAKDRAREIAAAYPADTRFQLLTSELRGEQMRWMDRDEYLSLLDEVDIVPTSPSLSQAMNRQLDLLRSTRSSARHAYVVSDFQQDATDTERLPSDSTVAFTLVPVAGQPHNNIALDTLLFLSPVSHVGATTTVQVRIRNLGDEPAQQVPLKLYVAGRGRAMQTVDLSAHESRNVELSFVVDEEGALSGHVETADFPITFDDTLHFALNVRPRVALLDIAESSPSESMTRLFADDSSVRFTAMRETALDLTALNRSDMVVVDHLRTISTGIAQALHSFVEGGGTLLLIPSAEGDPSSYNNLLSLFSAPTFASFRKEVRHALSPDHEQPLYSNVFTTTRADDEEAPSTQGHYPTQASASTLMRQVIGLQDGSPLLWETPCGEGRLYVLASPLQPQWSNFSSITLFVPTFYNMALQSLPVGDPYATIGSDQPYRLTASYDGQPVTHLLSTTDGSTRIVDIHQRGGRYCLFQHDASTPAGHFVLTGDDRAPREAVAFNYARTESDLSFLSGNELRNLVNDYDAASISVAPATSDLTTYLRHRHEGKQLWPWCIVLALLMLLVEILLLRLPLRSTSAPKPSK